MPAAVFSKVIPDSIIVTFNIMMKQVFLKRSRNNKEKESLKNAKMLAALSIKLKFLRE